MSDDRDWNQSFSKAKESYRKTKTEDDKRIIEKHAVSIIKEKSKWIITFLTKFGESDVVYFIDSGKWNKKRGKAKGRGAISMLNYFNPISGGTNEKES